MTVNKTIKRVRDLYSKNLKKHGVSSKSVGWPNSSDHKLRFEKLFTNVNLNNISSLNDLGAGYGSALDYILSQNYKLKTYYAYDISAEMLECIDLVKYPDIDIQKIQEPKTETEADFTIASGIFNVKFSENDEAWMQYILKTLENMNHFSKYGFSFNVLTSYVDFKRDHLYYADPCFFFDYCKKNFSRWVSLYHDYPLWEWTIVVRKLGE